MFAEAHRIAVESFERRLDHNTMLLLERFERRCADLKADVVKWSFVFWLGQMLGVIAAMAAMLG